MEISGDSKQTAEIIQMHPCPSLIHQIPVYPTFTFPPSHFYPERPSKFSGPNAAIFYPHNDKFLKIKSPEPTEATCPFCNATMLTTTQKKIGLGTIFFCIILCLFCFPLCLIPFVFRPCYDVIHYCSNCKRVIALKSSI